MRTKFWEHMTGLPVIACKVGKRGGLEKCGEDTQIYFMYLEGMGQM